MNEYKVMLIINDTAYHGLMDGNQKSLFINIDISDFRTNYNRWSGQYIILNKEILIKNIIEYSAYGMKFYYNDNLYKGWDASKTVIRKIVGICELLCEHKPMLLIKTFILSNDTYSGYCIESARHVNIIIFTDKILIAYNKAYIFKPGTAKYNDKSCIIQLKTKNKVYTLNFNQRNYKQVILSFKKIGLIKQI